MLKIDQFIIWFILLFSRFKQPVFITQKALQKQRYTLKNATMKREFWKYSAKIFWLSKNVNYTSSFFQINKIYNEFDYQLKKLIRPSEKWIFMLKVFLQKLNLIKHFWWEKKIRTYISHNTQAFEHKKDSNNKQYLIKKNDFGLFTIWNRSNNTINFLNNFFRFYFQNQNFVNYFYFSNRKAFQNQGQTLFDQNQFSNANQQQRSIIDVSQQFRIIEIVTSILFNFQKEFVLQVFQNRFSNTRNQSVKFSFWYIDIHLSNNQ